MAIFGFVHFPMLDKIMASLHLTVADATPSEIPHININLGKRSQNTIFRGILSAEDAASVEDSMSNLLDVNEPVPDYLPDAFEAKYVEIVLEGLNWQAEHGATYVKKISGIKRVQVRNSKSAARLVDPLQRNRVSNISSTKFAELMERSLTTKIGAKG